MVGKIVFFLVGLALVGAGVLFWWFGKKKRKECTGKVEGVVKKVDNTVTYKKGKVRNESRSTFAYSVDGVDYVKQSSTTTVIARFSEGQTVTVFYDPSKPQRFYVSEEGRSIAIPAVLIGLGVVSMLTALF